MSNFQVIEGGGRNHGKRSVVEIETIASEPNISSIFFRKEDERVTDTNVTDDTFIDFDNPPEVLSFARIMPIGEGEAREVYARALHDGYDAMLAEIVVYCLVEGFSRASGNDSGDYMRFHEHLHRNVGADLPEGLTPETLYSEAKSVMTDRRINRLNGQEMEDFAMEMGGELHEKCILQNANFRI
jgi:hypothetical protein